MSKLRDLEQALTIELDGRALEYDQAPDYDDLATRNIEPGPATAIDAPTIREPHHRRRLVPAAAAAAALLLAGGAAIATRDRGAEITAAADDALLYQWPTELPSGWEIIETELQVGPDHYWEAEGTLAAYAPGNRLVSLTVVIDDQAPSDGQKPLETRTIDGTDIEVLYLDVYDTFLQWRVGALRFELRTRHVGLDESMHLAAGTQIETDQESGDLTDLELPLTDDFEIVVDDQPFATNRGSVAFRVGCREREPDTGCAHTVSLSAPAQGSAQLDQIEFLGGGASITTHETPSGEVLLNSYQLGDAEFTHAFAVLDNGLILRVDPDMGPLDADPRSGAGHGVGDRPLTSGDVETILSGLTQIDADTFDELAKAIN